MRTLLGGLVLTVTVVVTMVVAGCVSLRPVAPVVDAPGGVRVLLAAVDDDRFRVDVVNYGRQPIVVDGDRVVLITPAGTRPHRTGGAGGRDRIAPGGRHCLQLRFALGGIHAGERVAISLDGAVTLDGQPLPVPPLELVAD